MNDKALAVARDLLDRVARHDFGMYAAVADVVEAMDGASLVADGRAPDLPDFNHAALLRSDRDGLLRTLVAFYEKRGRNTAAVIDRGAPAGIAASLDAASFVRTASRSELRLWNPDARHIYTAPEVYMTLATNATLEEYLRIATVDMPERTAEQARAMQTQQFRTAGFTFFFGLWGGVPAGACPLYVSDGMAQVGPVVVLPEYRRKGVGLALVNYVTRQSRKDGASVTYLFNERNGPATGLCETAGYATSVEDARQTWVRAR